MNIFNKYLCLEVFKGRKENVKEGKGRKGKERKGKEKVEKLLFGC
jgi:hypothetical protein